MKKQEKKKVENNQKMRYVTTLTIQQMQYDR